MRCGKSPTELGYGFFDEEEHDADEYCWTSEGTLDHASGGFLCDPCYIAWGMPVGLRRWTATPAHVAGMRLLFPDDPVPGGGPMTWTVKELKEALDDYGDHLPVRLVIESGNSSHSWPDFDVTTGGYDDGPAVELTADWDRHE